MPLTSASSSPSWTGSTADPPGGASGDRSRLTIRLPDISTPVTAPRELPSDLSRSRPAPPHAGPAAADGPSAEPSPPAATNPATSQWPARWQRATDVLRARIVPFVRQARFWLARVAAAVVRSARRQRATDVLRARVIPFVRQPKFWLACVTAVAVQVLLAAVMTPAEEDPPERLRTAANTWRKPAPEPAERIVVPPAQNSHDTIEPVSGGKHGMTTPLGLTAPFDSSEADGVDETSPHPRVAENRRPTPDGRQFDGVPAGEADGATLGGIVPLEPVAESSLHEQQR